MEPKPVVSVIEADSGENLETVRGLLEGYAGGPESEGYVFPEESQAFREQLADLPGCFAPPEGRLLIATYRGEPAGCVALRKLSNGVCEMKRLYVRPDFRGRKVGRKLTEVMIAQAGKIGYGRMRIHTVSSMKEAYGLYRSLGFAEIEPYEYSPYEDVMVMELQLT
jgi:ribosomal protein S18 acetylase RimI-like enzyme